jgi:biopolymer transport protein ExbD
MRLKLRRRSDSEAINVGPFADIAFLLIIFFILTTEFVKPAGDRIQIPSGTTDKARDSEKRLTVNLRPDEIRYGEKSRPVTLPELKGILAGLDLPGKPEEQRIVILDSAPEVAYQRYFETVMAIADAGGVLALIDHSAGGGK